MNTRENFWNVYCFVTNEKRDETAKDNRQTAAWISHDLIWNNELAQAGFFFQQRVTSSTNLQKPNYWIRNRPRSECKLSKFTSVQFFGWRLLSYKKIRIENHQSQPTSMTLWTAREANTVSPASDWLVIFCSQTRCLALSDPIYLIQHRFPVICH